MRLLFLLPLTTSLFIAAGDPTDATKKEVEKLQGTWETVSLLYNGKEHAADGKGKFRFTFKKDQAIVTGNEAIERDYGKIAVKLDPSTMPKCVDLTVTAGGQLNAVLEGIYDLKGDELRLCIAVFSKDRPLEFASPDGKSIALLVMKRVAAGE